MMKPPWSGSTTIIFCISGLWRGLAACRVPAKSCASPKRRSVHDVDLVLTDSPIDPALNVKAFNHLLGECGMILFGAPKLAAKYRRGFPRSLDGAPFLMPTRNTTARRSLDQWFDGKNIVPRIVAEFEDNALLKVFGQRGLGLFFAPSVIAAEVQKQYKVNIVGNLDDVLERFYAISLDRKLKHPAVVVISEAAKARLGG